MRLKTTLMIIRDDLLKLLDKAGLIALNTTAAGKFWKQQHERETKTPNERDS